MNFSFISREKIALLVFKLITYIIAFSTAETETTSKSKTKSTQKTTSIATTTGREYYSISSTARQIVSLYRNGDVSIRKIMGL